MADGSLETGLGSRVSRAAVAVSLSAALAFLSILGCRSSDRAETVAGVRMYRAIHLDGTREWEEEVRRRLHCGPCKRFTDLDVQGKSGVYLFNADAPMELPRSDIISVLVGRSDRSGERRPYVLVLTLTSSGRERLAGYVGNLETVVTVNEIQGELIGLTSLTVVDDVYVVARFAEQEEAEAMASSLGVPVRVQREDLDLGT